MKKWLIYKKFSYWFDCMMSKGPVAMTGLLFAITAAAVGVIGILAYFVSDEGGILFQLWQSLMYTLDAGNLSGVPTGNKLYLLLMSVSTVCGLFLTSVLIGIIATGVEDKLKSLRKGTSVVQENNHTVIIGFNNDIYTVLQELIEANSNKKKACIVVLGQQEKEKMEEEIASHISDTKTTRIICRSGNLHEAYALERCSVETCKSVIINITDDAETIKIMLALATYIKGKNLVNPQLRFVATLQDSSSVEAAKIAGEGRSAIIFAKDAIARIISNTCRQHGLSQVLTELFNFSGNELYYEHIPSLEGKSFREAIMSFSNAVAVGLCAGERVLLNPPMETVIGKDDRIILLERDDGDYNYHPAKAIDESKITADASLCAKASDRLIILGSNEKMPTILTEYAKYVSPGTRVVIVDDDIDAAKLGAYDNLDITICTERVTGELLCGFLEANENNILLLNDDSLDSDSSDSQTLFRLILLRHIADNKGIHFAITTEMRSADSQRLASQARVDDFVIGSNFASLMMAQISENPELIPLIEDLLDERGSELYMKPAANYVPVGIPVNSYILSESAARKGEIYLGYRHNGTPKSNVVINPAKEKEIVFGENDQIVVIAEN